LIDARFFQPTLNTEVAPDDTPDYGYHFNRSPVTSLGKPSFNETSSSDRAFLVDGAITDGSSVLVLSVAPYFSPQQIPFLFKLTEAKSADTSEGRAGSLFDPIHG